MLLKKFFRLDGSAVPGYNIKGESKVPLAFLNQLTRPERGLQELREVANSAAVPAPD